MLAKCFRSDILIRGANTNNHVEAQFLVIKDNIIRRQRQYNINMLFDKLMVEFEDHFKRRILSVADGTFDETLYPIICSRYLRGKPQINCKKGGKLKCLVLGYSIVKYIAEFEFEIDFTIIILFFVLF